MSERSERLTLRVSKAVVARLDALAPNMVTRGAPYNRTTAALAALEAGASVLEERIRQRRPTCPPTRLTCTSCHAPTSEEDGAEVTDLGTFCPDCKEAR